jgi:hypothetical protein
MSDLQFMPDELNISDYIPLTTQLSDAELDARIAEDRSRILGAIFARMPDYFDPAAAGDVDAIVEWRILGRPEGGHDTFHMVIRERLCSVSEGSHPNPSVTISLGPVPFVRVVTGQENPIRLFTFGKLSVKGNLVLAAKVSKFFDIPSVGSA